MRSVRCTSGRRRPASPRRRSWCSLELAVRPGPRGRRNSRPMRSTSTSGLPARRTCRKSPTNPVGSFRRAWAGRRSGGPGAPLHLSLSESRHHRNTVAISRYIASSGHGVQLPGMYPWPATGIAGATPAALETKCPVLLGDSPRIHPVCLIAPLHQHRQELQNAFPLNCPVVIIGIAPGHTAGGPPISGGEAARRRPLVRSSFGR